MKEPVRIFSDLHLGHRVSRIGSVSAMRPLIAGAGTVVFNGDTWQELPSPFRQRAEVMLGELRALCAEEGAEAVFLSGNHDPGWDGPGWLALAEGRIVVTHGDALWDSGSPWKREILLGGKRVRELWAEHPDAVSDVGERLTVARKIARELCSTEYPLGRHILLRALDAVTPPQRALRMIEAWLHQGAAGARFCERYFPGAEVLVIGHFHYHGCWVTNGRMVLNTGSFLDPGRAHCVEWKDGWLGRHEIDETPHLLTLGRRLGAWRFI